MKITYQYTQAGYAPYDPTNPSPKGAFSENQANQIFQVNMGPVVFTIEPRGDLTVFDVPACLLRNGSVISSNIVIQGGGDGPHQDYKFCRQSSEHTYHVRSILSSSSGGAVTGVMEKEMTAGSQPGDIGKLILYKGATTLADIASGNWSERLIRPFTITAADLANRDTGWPQTATATAPTYDTAKKQIVDGGGDGYLHV